MIKAEDLLFGIQKRLTAVAEAFFKIVIALRYIGVQNDFAGIMQKPGDKRIVGQIGCQLLNDNF